MRRMIIRKWQNSKEGINIRVCEWWQLMCKTCCLIVTSYYCPLGSKYVKPPGFQCTVGHYCPGGDPEPIPCRNNSYVNYTGAVECEPCPAGFYCVIAGTTVICPEGESRILLCVCDGDGGKLMCNYILLKMLCPPPLPLNLWFVRFRFDFNHRYITFAWPSICMRLVHGVYLKHLICQT